MNEINKQGGNNTCLTNQVVLILNKPTVLGGKKKLYNQTICNDSQYTN